MSYSSSAYSRGTHGVGSSGTSGLGLGVYGKSSGGGSGTSSTSKYASAVPGPSNSGRPATLSLASTSSSSKNVPAPKTSPNPFTSVVVTTTTTTFPTMGSTMLFQNRISRYASPAIPPLVQSKASSSSYTNLSNVSKGNSTTNLNVFSPSRTTSTTTTTCQSHLSSSASTSSSHFTYSQPRGTMPDAGASASSSYYNYKPLSSSTISQQQDSRSSGQLQPYKSSLNLGYGRTSIPYYQTRLSSYSSSQNLPGTVSEGETGGPVGPAADIHVPLLKSRNITDRMYGSGIGSGSSGGLGSNQNLSSLGISDGGIPMQSSRSSQNLNVGSSNVFCLSCPPAQLKFSDAYRAKTLPRTGKENERLIGFATLPEQVHRKSVKKGFDFTLMVVGESGLGKSTLVNSLFLADFYQNRKIPSVNEQISRTTTIQKHTIEIEERGVKLRLTVVDTPGFGDAINCEESWKTCVQYIDDQFHQYFQAESGLNRKHIQDTRVHCCLYFVPPYGRGLRALDLEVLKNLESRVNVIPIIAKADTLTTPEVKRMKEQILHDLKSNQIQIYQFPECDEEEDEEFKKQDTELKASIPFAVASSITLVDGKRGRQYPWGIVEIENPNHSDFGKLRTMLIQSHMHDLKETTQDFHYENFRARAISQISQGRNARERTKLKRDSSMDSPQELLLQKEAEIKKMQQMISKMEAKLKAQNSRPSSRDSIIDL